VKNQIPLNLIVNSRKYQVTVSPDTRLVDVLRDHLGFTGTKVGCGIGRCGSCTVLVDDKPLRSCQIPVGRVVGKNILTIESLNRGGTLHPLQEAFINTNAVQCGFCTPGIIMEFIGLFRRVPGPSEDDIKNALSGHLCRCTGYLQIMEAIRLFLGRIGLPDKKGVGVGFSPPREDVISKVTGRAGYSADISLSNQLYGKILRSTIAHGAVKRILINKALNIPGVVRVITQADIPGEKNYGKARRDQPVLAHDRVRFIGDPVALVLAETVKEAERAAEAIEIEYEKYTPVYTAEEAIQDSAAFVHDGGNIASEFAFQLGSPDDALQNCDVIIEENYETPRVEHACLEPEAAVSYYDEHGLLTVIAPTQNVYFDRREIANVLGLKRDLVRVSQPAVGGAFGKREDLYAQILCALGTFLTRQPVKIVFSREETFQVTTKRHPFRMRYRTGVSEDGKILVQDIDILADTGAYASWAPNIMRKAAAHACGPYRIPNVRVRARSCYTNNPPSGAMRGFGVPQVAFACESQMDTLADHLGMNPVTLRRLNLLTDGASTATGQTLYHCSGLTKTLERALTVAKNEPLKPTAGTGELDPSSPFLRRGRGCATIIYGIGYGYGIPDIGSAIVELTSSGLIKVRAGAVEYGQGIATVLRQIVVTELSISSDRVTIVTPDTQTTPDSGSTVASRQTYITGNAVRRAVQGLREIITAALSEKWNCPSGQVALTEEGGLLKESSRKMSWDEIAAYLDAMKRPRKRQARFRAKTGPIDNVEGGNPYAIYAFATQVADVEVNIATGDIRVLRIVAAHDMGKALNPGLARGQIYGGVMMGLGYALFEEFRVKDGIMQTSNFNSYRIPGIKDVPEIVPVLIEEPEETGPYGARGLGEPPVIPTAPAIANAIFNATGIRIRSLPISPSKIKMAIGKINVNHRINSE